MCAERSRERSQSPWLILFASALVGAPTLCEAQQPNAKAAVGPRLVRLVPGGSVKDGPPVGWSHRIIRSVPRLASGDLSSLPRSAATTASLFRTVIVADVVARGGAYELSKVGTGNAVSVGRREIVVTPEGPPEALDTLGMVDKVVLKKAEAELDLGRLVAHTATFALLKSPATMVVVGKHQAIDLYYAMLVDPQTGSLTTYIWTSPAGKRVVPSQIVELPQDVTFNVALDARATKWLGPVPLAWSFAMAALPPGRRVPVPAPFARAIAEAQTTADPSLFENALRVLPTLTDRR